MRITNKIMQNNSLYNINSNKVLQDELTTQMSTQKKIARPSDDPVVAIRSLRLRTNLSNVTQYYEKNVPDADNWLNLTESALNTVSSVLTDMRTNCVKGANGDITVDDRKIILENLNALKKEVYSTGDTDYAGRSIFTGYRTDMALTITEAKNNTMSITEQLTNEALSDITYVEAGDLTSLNEGNYSSIATDEYGVSATTVHRIRLAYNDIDTNGTVSLKVATGYDADGNTTYDDISTNITTVSQASDPNPYQTVLSDDDAVVFVPETGEVLLGANVYATISAYDSDTEIAVTYDKTQWAVGDLNPVHYFACTETSSGIAYNQDYMSNRSENDDVRQIMEYDVGFNQTLRVNTTADECFTHDIGRDIDELTDLVEELQDINALVDKLNEMIEDPDYEADVDFLNEKLDAAMKAQTYINDKVQKGFEKCIDSMDDYLDQFNLAITQVGSRSARLKLIENRLMNQQTSFQELVSDNDEADITQLAVELSSAELSYQAALAATGKVVQTTLLNFL